MKIGYVTPRYPPNVIGGGERSLQLLAEQMRERGHDVEVLSFDSEPENDFDYVIREELDSRRSDIQNIKARGRIKKFAEDKDVVHSYNTTFNPAVASIKNTKTVATLNSYHFFYPYDIPGMEQDPISRVYRSLHDFACRRILTGMDQFIALSTAVKEQYSRILPENKIEVIPNMYDPEFPKEVSVETDEKELLYVGSLLERKGVLELIERMPDLEEYRLTIVGDGDERENLERKVENLGVEDRVTFEGKVDYENLPEYYARAGWFIHPGQWPEPFGRTILEAMQMETAVIATDKGGPKDVLSDKQLLDMSDLAKDIGLLKREDLIEEQKNMLDTCSPEEVTALFDNIYAD